MNWKVTRSIMIPQILQAIIITILSGSAIKLAPVCTAADTYDLYMNENKATTCDSHHKHNSANT